MKSISELAGELKGVGGGWEVVVLGWAYGVARGVAEVVFQELDRELDEEEGRGPAGEGFQGTLSHHGLR